MRIQGLLVNHPFNLRDCILCNENIADVRTFAHLVIDCVSLARIRHEAELEPFIVKARRRLGAPAALEDIYTWLLGGATPAGLRLNDWLVELPLPGRYAPTARADVVTLLGLRPLYEAHVRPFRRRGAVPAGSAPQASVVGGELPELDPTYTRYVADLPGKPDLAPDAGLRELLFGPRRGESIRPIQFDRDTLDAAFTLAPGLARASTARGRVIIIVVVGSIGRASSCCCGFGCP
ncbi:hypothetical protein HK105_204932 [Polyrhizophydium stewartii]|uniref:Mediator of RNA polymerase II transcription subunit 19 n=1 Tax=Polyrhizophydium stewartii TaxID=2732419 RepID=A0ABR4N7Q9_9FUNG